MSDDEKDLVKRAYQIFRGESTSYENLVGLGKKLQAVNQLDNARRIFEKAFYGCPAEENVENRVKLLKNLILVTYKDSDLPADTRLRQAETLLSILFGEAQQGDLEKAHPHVLEVAKTLSDFPELKQDLLGIAGAVQKRRWDIYGLRVHLVRSYQYYWRGYQMGTQFDNGYNGINLAFVLDLLGEQEKGELGEGMASRAMANLVRREIVRTIEPANEADRAAISDWWVLVTLGEAFLGLGEYEKAAGWMKQAAEYKKRTKEIQPWQFETSARQVSQLARLKAQRDFPNDELEGSRPWNVVRALLEGDSTAAASFLLGKLGLALSGGGFRASLFHIGVLAKLAELDVLRHVEVLSCVSGGSILGAYYYLELRNVLKNKTDAEMQRSDYIELVERMRKNFVAGIQKNIRLRMLFGVPSNWRVLTSRRSSSSDRLARLYEKELFALVDDGEQNKPRYLADLYIVPMELDQAGNKKPPTDFKPKYDNWKRLNKVPSLILNATSLNTCHNWQFTASFMGEPPARSIDAEIDANHRLRRMYHDEAPGRYWRPKEGAESSGVRLSEAVAASACVPGLFDPLLLEDLYGSVGPNKDLYETLLVDGGNYDNQGIASLREQDCNVLIVSDACGQTALDTDPSAGHIGVIGRANDILMSRSREAQYQLLSALEDAKAIQGMMYLHLKKGLQAQTVDWLCCTDPSAYVTPEPLTDYGVREDVQRLLAGIRTDLDSFSWVESDALMLSGYLMAASEWKKCLPNIATSTQPKAVWEFERLAPVMTDKKPDPRQLADLIKTLTAAKELTFKPLQLYPALMVAGWALLTAILLAVVWRIYLFIPGASGKIMLFQVVGAVAALIGVKHLLKRLARYRNSYAQVLNALIACTVGWIVFYPYLKLIDPLYVKWGSSYRNR